jgi:hypothetical protein
MEWPHIRGLKDLKVQYGLLKQQTKAGSGTVKKALKKHSINMQR